MQDIRKPYTRSRSSNDLQSRVEQFEAARYRQDHYDDDPVQIPVRRKRRDIDEMEMYPTRYGGREEELYEEDEEAENRRPVVRRNDRARYSKKRSSLSTVGFIVLVIALVIGVSLYTYVFDKATITIVPKYKDVTDIKQAFLFSQEGSTGTGIPFIVASTSLSRTKTLTLSESRKVEAKASGKITVYNNYDSTPQKLIKNTRFESAQGKIYRINQSIEVPGKKGGTPGSVEVMVYADSVGADYNIETSSFTIPGFKGTARETTFYAKTKTAITGGASGNMQLASISDVNAAKDSLALELDKAIKEESKKMKKDGYIAMYGATEVLYVDNESELLNGGVSTYKVTATANIMFASAPKLAEALAKTFGDYDGSPVRLIYDDTLVFTRKDTDHITGSDTLSIFVEGKPRVIWESNIQNIKDLVKGNNRDEFKPLMKTIDSIESAEISFSPMWLTHFPGDTSKIIVIESLPKR